MTCSRSPWNADACANLRFAVAYERADCAPARADAVRLLQSAGAELSAVLTIATARSLAAERNRARHTIGVRQRGHKWLSGETELSYSVSFARLLQIDARSTAVALELTPRPSEDTELRSLELDFVLYLGERAVITPVAMARLGL